MQINTRRFDGFKSILPPIYGYFMKVDNPSFSLTAQITIAMMVFVGLSAKSLLIFILLW